MSRAVTPAKDERMMLLDKAAPCKRILFVQYLCCQRMDSQLRAVVYEKRLVGKMM